MPIMPEIKRENGIFAPRFSIGERAVLNRRLGNPDYHDKECEVIDIRYTRGTGEWDSTTEVRIRVEGIEGWIPHDNINHIIKGICNKCRSSCKSDGKKECAFFSGERIWTIVS